MQNFVQQCTICQQAKVAHIKLPGLLKPLLVPAQAWEVISLDFMEGLPASDHFNAVLVVIDKFSKYGHFIPIHHPYTAIQIAKLFLDHVYKLHGLPKAIISDHDPVFTSHLWQELFKLTDTKLLMSSAYHPVRRSDSINAWKDSCGAWSILVPRQWSKWLLVAEFWYNTPYHSVLGRSPFEVLYGHSP